MLQAALPHLVPAGAVAPLTAEVRGRLVQRDALMALAFGDLFGPHEDRRPDGLRTGVAAPYPPQQIGDEEQGEGGDGQRPHQQHEVLWPQGQPEDVELALGQIEQNGLMAVDLQPGRQKVAKQQGPAGVLPDGLEQAFHLADVDLFLLLIEIEDA